MRVNEQTAILLRILDEHGAGLHALLARLTLSQDVAEDLLQELFLKLNASNGFARAQNHPAYARRTAINLAFMWRRRHLKDAAQAASFEPPSVGLTPLDRLLQDEEMNQILAAVERLGQPLREAFVLRHIEDRPYEEIAEQLRRSAHQVRALSARAMERVRRQVEAAKQGAGHAH